VTVREDYDDGPTCRGIPFRRLACLLVLPTWNEPGDIDFERGPLPPQFVFGSDSDRIYIRPGTSHAAEPVPCDDDE
jgi:hypothetical protein